MATKKADTVKVTFVLLQWLFRIAEGKFSPVVWQFGAVDLFALLMLLWGWVSKQKKAVASYKHDKQNYDITFIKRKMIENQK